MIEKSLTEELKFLYMFLQEQLPTMSRGFAQVVDTEIGMQLVDLFGNLGNKRSCTTVLREITNFCDEIVSI